MKIPLAKPFVSEEHMRVLKEVLDSGQFIQGRQTAEFEKEFAAFLGCKYAVAASSGTSALHLALLSSGVRKGDDVITVSHTFIATLESIWHVQAHPKVADIDERFYGMDPNHAKGLRTKKTRAIIPVHIFGHPVDMDPLRDIAERRGLMLIEDAAQAHGSMYKGRLVGTLSDVSCFSFYPSKNMTVCGDGGMLVTNNEEIAARTRMLRDHGRKEKYSSDLVGYNYRLSEISSAIGRVGLKHLVQWNDERRTVASIYNELLSDCKEIMIPRQAEWAHHVYYVYAIRAKHRDKLKDWLSNNGIQTGIHYPIPCHLQPVYARMEGKLVRLEKTERVAKELLSLPMYPGMTREEVDYVATKIKQFYDQQS
jgi:perosamine synthetase